MARLKQLTLDYKAAQKRLEDNTAQITQNQQLCAQTKQAETQLRTNLKVLVERSKAAKGIDLNRMNSSLVVGRTKERVLKETIAVLETGIDSDKCPKCRRILSAKDAEELEVHRKEELTQVRKDYAEVKAKLSAAEKKTQEAQRILEAATKADLERSKIEVKLNRLRTVLDTTERETTRLTQENTQVNLAYFEEQLKVFKDRTNRADADRLEQELLTQTKALSSLREQIDRMNVEYGSLVKNSEDLEQQLDTQKQLQTELDKLNAEYATYDKLREYFGKDGIQSVIIDNVIGELETYTNDVLSRICNEPTTIAIKTQKQNDNGSWAETFDIEVSSDGRVDDLDTYSGGESLRVSLALRLSLSSILSKRMGGTMSFLLMDEVDAPLDEKGTEMLVSIVRQLSKEMKILLITHNEKLKDKFNDIIIVNKTSAGSKIIQQ